MAVTNRLIDLMSDWQKQHRKPLPVAKLARDLGVSRQHIYAWLNDELEAYPREMIDKICDYFNCEPGDLIVRAPKETEPEAEAELTPGGD